MKMRQLAILATLGALLLVGGAGAQNVELVLTSWRTEDIPQWDIILSMFHERYPNVRVRFEPVLNTAYDAQLRASLEGGQGADLITCRPYDLSLDLFKAGFLTDVTNLPGLEHFGDVARSAWRTDDGATVYCVPMASVIHGFIYNRDLFAQAGITDVPTTQAEFIATLQRLKDAGIQPLDIATKDAWTVLTMGFNNIGPSYFGGEPGRQALIAGTAKFTDEGFVNAFRAVNQWAPFLLPGHEAIGYADTQQSFFLGSAAIFPAGSWEITIFETNADFELGAFPPPLPEAGAQCWISDHVDIAIGLNPSSPNQGPGLTFLQWLTTQQFAQAYSSLLPGFFSLSDHPISLEDPLAQEFVSWRSRCGSTVRVADERLSRGTPAGNTLLQEVIPAMLQGKITPEEAAARVQAGLDLWYRLGQ